MALLIDGYNLLFAIGLTPHEQRPGGLEQARSGLLRFLSQALTPEERIAATIVFDAGQTRALRREATWVAGMQVLYSRFGLEADDVLEELIAGEPNAAQLTVVSSDHRLQRAATRRRAKFVDSEPWYLELRRRLWLARQPPPNPSDPAPTKPVPSEADTDFNEWFLAMMLAAEATAEHEAESSAADDPNFVKPSPSAREADDDKPLPDAYDPFPPGYTEDVARWLEEDFGSEGESAGGDDGD